MNFSAKIVLIYKWRGNFKLRSHFPRMLLVWIFIHTYLSLIENIFTTVLNHVKVWVTSLSNFKLLNMKCHVLHDVFTLRCKRHQVLRVMKDTSLSSLQVISFSVHRNNGVFQLVYAYFKFGQDIQLQTYIQQDCIFVHLSNQKIPSLVILNVLICLYIIC